MDLEYINDPNYVNKTLIKLDEYESSILIVLLSGKKSSLSKEEEIRLFREELLERLVNVKL